MAYDFSLERVPKGYPVGWVHAPGVFDKAEEMRQCSALECPHRPEYEIYHGTWIVDDYPLPPGLTDGWWYMCEGHKLWLEANSKEAAHAQSQD